MEIEYKDGLIPAVVQDEASCKVLMLGYMNPEALEATLRTGFVTFYSRSRQKLWVKGETSGHTQRVVDILVDCDSDSLTVLVKPNGPACHTGKPSCFHNALQEADSLHEKIVDKESDLGTVLNDLYALVESRRRDRPEGSYTTYLFDQGLDKILKKVGEEASETIISAKNDDRAVLVKEASDLLYHLIVLIVERGLTLEQIRGELVSRGKKRDVE